ncbi:MAG: AI-2E family transporter [Defluviitaleaceae bacterium]|nr:AI-2E family transporter [Defluviitaleaceae bacterium]
MDRVQIWEKFKTLIPYFLLAAAIILFWRLSGSLGVFGDFLGWSWAVVSPFFWGFVIAYIINIPCGSIQKLLGRSNSDFIRRKQRVFAVLITLVIVLGLIALALSFIIPAVVRSITTFIENIDAYWAGVVGFIDTVNNLGIIEIHADDIFDFLGGLFENFSLENLAQPLNAIISAGGTIVNVVITIISSIYILIEKDRLKASASKLFRVFSPKKFYEGVSKTLARLNIYFRQYLRTQTLDGVILGTIVTIALTILGSDFALVLGILLGILNYIPIFGSLFGTIVAILVVMFTQGFTAGLISAAVLVVIQQLDANVIQPRLMGESFSFSPLLIIISITVGGAIAGVMGMIIAIPVAAVIKDIFTELSDAVEKAKFGTVTEVPEKARRGSGQSRKPRNKS